MMKTRLLMLVIFLLLILNLVFCQTDKDSMNSGFLPDIGDWAVGIDATPIFQYAGNLFSQNGNPYTPSIKFNAEYPNSVYLKYRTGYSTTLRAIITFGLDHTADNIINPDDESNPHELINSALNIGLITGVERRKSIKNRLLSYYGAQIGIQKIPYNNGSTLGFIEYVDKNDEELYFKEYGGNTISLLASVFIGLEYYLFPRFAISGEINLGGSRQVQKERYRKRGTSDAEIIDDKMIIYEVKPGTSGKIGLLIYF